MKKTVLEQLEQRGLLHIYSESKFESFKTKVTRQSPHGNRYYLALLIFDMFILNS